MKSSNRSRQVRPALGRAFTLLVASLLGTACHDERLPAVDVGQSPAASDVHEETVVAEQPALVEPEGIKRHVPGTEPTQEEEAEWEAKAAAGEDFYALELLPEVKVASQKLADEAVVQPGKLTVPLEGNEALLELGQGAVLTGNRAGLAGRQRTGSNNLFGFARKVKSVKVTGGQIVIETEPAHIEDVVTGAAHLSMPATATEAIETLGADLSAYFFGHPKPEAFGLQTRGRYEQQGGPLTIDLSVSQEWGSTVEREYFYKKEKEVGAVTLSIEAALTAKSTFKFKPTFELYVWIKGFKLRKLKVGAGGQVKAGAAMELEVKVTAEAGAQSESVEDAMDKLGKEPLDHEPDQTVLATLGPYKGPVIGTVPTTFVVEFVAACKFEMSGTVKIEAEGGVEAGAYFGVEFDRDRSPQWRKILKTNWKHYFQGKGTVSAGAELKCTVGPRVNWVFAEVGGPYAELRGGVKGRFDYEVQCKSPFEISKGEKPDSQIVLGADVGVEVNVGGKADLVVKKVEIGPFTLWDKWWTVWEKTWKTGKGLGWCMSACENNKLDPYVTGQDGPPALFESGVDCGGPQCKKCGAGADCNSSADCTKPLKCTYKKCSTLNSSDPCNDGKKGPGEMDVDCGGKCGKCALGQSCYTGAHCASGSCVDKKCVDFNCDNGFKDSGEADVDCGGVCKETCYAGQHCWNDKDCGSPNKCNPFGGNKLCVQSNCKSMGNGKKDGGETDVDCGGSCMDIPVPQGFSYMGNKGKDLFKCKKNRSCNSDKDCKDGNCIQETGKCGPEKCFDKIQDGGEPDVDCGGPCKVKCKHKDKCYHDKDCDFAKDKVTCSNWNGEKFAGQATCTRYWQNGRWDKKHEPDVDCGGKDNPVKCKLFQYCWSTADCAAGHSCITTSFGVKRCLKSGTCGDEKLTGDESDVDCGMACGGGFAEGCVKGLQCRKDKDCRSEACEGPKFNNVGVGTAGKCLGMCENGRHDPKTDEGDVDCGGPECPGKCPNGKRCKGHHHCQSGFCSPFTWRCKSPTCDDGLLSGKEADVDCGGDCEFTCGTGKKCGSGKDCYSKSCANNLCLPPPCSNGKQDLGESDVDCGGSCEDKCADGKLCIQGSDCETGQCLKGGKCGFDPCQDGVKSGAESDVDCGGGCATKCGTGKGCATGKDCASGFCDGAACVASACEDKKHSPGESDVDCGGSCKAKSKCATGKACKGAADCASGFCDGTVCVASACEDKQKSPLETDTDCGGPCKLKCPLKGGCKTGADCASNVCNGVVCVSGSCFDAKKTDDESDVDCGGKCKAKCSTGKSCATGTDCTSGVCSVDGVCVLSTCDDGKLSPAPKGGAAETDVDCGGPCETDCVPGAKCKVDDDCESGLCAVDSAVCVTSTCFDEVLTEGEMALDCGGPCEKGCAVGLPCKATSDCASGICSAGGKCVGTTCEDGFVSGDETGKDCGGSCAADCAFGLPCKANEDCATGQCGAATGGEATCVCPPALFQDAQAGKCVACGCKDPGSASKVCDGQGRCTCKAGWGGDKCDVKVNVCVTDQLDCDDNEVCSADSCDPKKGCLHDGAGAEGDKCDDGDKCTLADACKGGKCTPASKVTCKDDGSACTVETCDTASGLCGTKALVCDDKNECTLDQCDKAKGCAFPAVNDGKIVGTCDGSVAGGRCIDAFTGSWATWQQARDACKAWGGDLVVIRDAGDNNAARYRRNSRCGTSSAWIGLSDAAKEGEWVWVDGSKATFFAWSSGEPNNYGGDEDMVAMLSKGQWNDSSATSKLSCRVCERPLPPQACAGQGYCKADTCTCRPGDYMDAKQCVGCACAVAGTVSPFDGKEAPPVRMRPAGTYGVGYGDAFGQGVAAWGNRVIVGAPNDDSKAWNAAGTAIINRTDAGVAYIWERRPDGTWKQHAKLTAPDTASNSHSGRVVAIAGDRAAMNRDKRAVPKKSGRCYPPGLWTWHRQASGSWGVSTFIAPLGEKETWCSGMPAFPVALAMDAAVLAASSSREINKGGSPPVVWVYGAVGDTWTRRATLRRDAGSKSSLFGSALAASGDLLAVGDPKDSGVKASGGAVWVYRHEAGIWRRRARIDPKVTADSSYFGLHLAAEGHRVVTANNKRTVFVFDRDAQGTWRQTYKHAQPDSNAVYGFGARVGVSGDAIFVSSQQSSSKKLAGSVAVFRPQGGALKQVALWKNPDAKVNDGFGAALAVRGTTVVVGARHASTQGSGGQAWLWSGHARCDGQGQCACRPHWGGPKCDQPIDVCKAKGLVCDDGNDCTADTCDPKAGCKFTADDKAKCDDGDACTSVEVCKGGVCKSGGPPKTCKDDGDPCTVEYCNGATGACLALAKSCDDGQPCTLDVCEAGKGCVASKIPFAGMCGGGAGKCQEKKCICATGTVIAGQLCADCGCSQPGSTATWEPPTVLGEIVDEPLAQKRYVGDVLAMDGGVIAAGLWRKKVGARTGVVLITEKQKSGGWKRTAVIQPVDQPSLTYFGQRLALSGDTLAVSHFYDKRRDMHGAVYLFRRDLSGMWRQQDVVFQTDAKGGKSSSEEFSKRIALEGVHLAVATRKGAVFFARQGSRWVRGSTISCVGLPYNQSCGGGLAISGAWAALSADGSAYPTYNRVIMIARLPSGAWETRQILTMPGLPNYSNFGRNLTLDGDRLVTHARGPTPSLYFYRLQGEIWSLWQVIEVSDPKNPGDFGASLDLAGDRLLVGAPTLEGMGAAWLYRLTGTVFTQVVKLRPPAARPNDRVGQAVAVGSEGLLIGAPYHDRLDPSKKPIADSGAAYIIVPRGKCDAKGVCECKPGWSGIKCEEKSDVCKADALSCDDGNACTKDACDPKKGCVHSADDAAKCDDGDACSAISTCKAGKCVSAQLTTCKPSANACVVAYCKASTGKCATKGKVCDDGNPCTKDACDPVQGCQAPDEVTGTVCGSGGTCRDGTCLCGEGTMAASGGCKACECVHWKNGKTHTQIVHKWPSPIDSAKRYWGQTVGIGGDTAVIVERSGGSYRPAHVFRRLPNGTWSKNKTSLAPSTSSVGYQTWAYKLHVESGRVVANNRYDTTRGIRGAVHVFERDAAGKWSQHKLYATDTGSGGKINEEFGSSLAAAGGHILVGAQFATVGPLKTSGRYYSFARKPDGTWSRTAASLCLGASYGARCGKAMAMAGTWAAVSAPSASEISMIRRLPSGQWQGRQLLKAPIPLPYGGLGDQLVMDGDTLVATGAAHNNKGESVKSLLLFRRVGDRWVYSAKRTNFGGNSGLKVHDLDGGRLVFGTQQWSKSSGWRSYTWTQRVKGGVFGVQAALPHPLDQGPTVAVDAGVFMLGMSGMPTYNSDGSVKHKAVGTVWLQTQMPACSKGAQGCYEKAACTEGAGGKVGCTCQPGYEGDGTNCKDIDECKTGTHTCSKHATCTNTAGSFTCKCKPPAQGNGTKCKPWVVKLFSSAWATAWTVPASLNKVEKVTVIGGFGGKGGGGASGKYNGGKPGRGGGLRYTNWKVKPGEKYLIVAGGNGQNGLFAKGIYSGRYGGKPGGGTGGRGGKKTASGQGGGGGAFSGVFRYPSVSQSNAVFLAGGGGGGGGASGNSAGKDGRAGCVSGSGNGGQALKGSDGKQSAYGSGGGGGGGSGYVGGRGGWATGSSYGALGGWGGSCKGLPGTYFYKSGSDLGVGKVTLEYWGAYE